jgi:hypothetical protein
MTVPPEAGNRIKLFLAFNAFDVARASKRKDNLGLALKGKLFNPLRLLGFKWWTLQDSNLRPRACDARALTS